jgi:serpin B
MFLINTIYFKSDWRTPFDAADTVDATFHATAGDVSVKMMKKIDSFGYYENEDLQAVRLPYSDGRTSMLILLPKPGHEGATETLDSLIWKTVLDGVNAGNEEMVLRLPRTQFEFKAELKSTLSDLGMPTAFTDFADFTGISADGGLMIGSVIHKTFLAIDEKGTEAAAATSVDIRVTSMPSEPDLKVTVDRPFVVAIVDDLTGLPLFIGNIATP